MAKACREDFKAWLKEYDSENRFQTIWLPIEEQVIHGRDDIRRLFNGMNLPDEFWKDKIILDIGCDCGGWSFEALHRGAKLVFGFDKNPKIIRLANKLVRLFDYTDKATFLELKFEDMAWKGIAPISDVVFINQCLYRFSTGDKTFKEISPFCKDYLFLYTWTTDLEPYPEISETIVWAPTVSNLSLKAKEAGFKYRYVVTDEDVSNLKEKHQFLFSKEKEINCFGTQEI
jgi:SAM-dependent methyltransferase